MEERDEQTTGDREPVAEEHEDGDAQPDANEESGSSDNAADKIAAQAEPLLEGDAVSSPAGPLPKRSLTGIGVFIVVFLIVFFALWAWLGGIGLFLGLFVGAAVGLGAMKLLADRSRS